MENEIKISFVEAEATKLSLQPGDVLGVKVTSNEITDAAMANLQDMLTDIFPNNRVMLFCMKPNDTITFEKIQTAPKNCSTEYCEDCNCGKKESALKQGEQE